MSRDEVLARYPGARWREVNDLDREWLTATGYSEPSGYVTTDVKIRRVADGIERTVTSHGTMVEAAGDEAIDEAIYQQLYWWTEGNGGCESNLERFFLRAAGEPEPDIERPHRCDHVEYQIVWPEWLADDRGLDPWPVGEPGTE